MGETEQELVDEMVKVYRKEVESAVKKINAGEVKRLSDMEEEVKVSQPEVQVREGVGKNKQLEGSLFKSSVGSNFKISDELTPKNGTHPILPST